MGIANLGSNGAVPRRSCAIRVWLMKAWESSCGIEWATSNPDMKIESLFTQNKTLTHLQFLECWLKIDWLVTVESPDIPYLYATYARWSAGIWACHARWRVSTWWCHVRPSYLRDDLYLMLSWLQAQEYESTYRPKDSWAIWMNWKYSPPS